MILFFTSFSCNNPIGTDIILDKHSNSIYNINNLIFNGTAYMISASIVQWSATYIPAVNGSFVRLAVENLTVDPAWID